MQELNKKNEQWAIDREIELLFKMTLDEDEVLYGNQWEEMHVGEYDTPLSILNMFIDIFLATDFETYDEDIDEYILITDKTGRIQTLKRLFETLANDMEKSLEVK